MKRTIEELKIRIHKLEQRDPVINKNIVNKLKRRITSLQLKELEEVLNILSADL